MCKFFFKIKKLIFFYLKWKVLNKNTWKDIWFKIIKSQIIEQKSYSCDVILNKINIDIRKDLSEDESFEILLKHN